LDQLAGKISFVSRYHADIRATTTGGGVGGGGGAGGVAIEVKHVSGNNKTYVQRKCLAVRSTVGTTVWEDISKIKEFTQLAANDLISFGHDVPGGNAPERLCTLLVCMCARLY